MALQVGTNSWVSQAEADAYLADRLGADAWTGATSQKKDQALVTAWRDLTSHPHYALSKTTATQDMKDAQCEQALFRLQNESEIDKRMALAAQGVTRIQLIGGFIENYGGVVLPVAAAATARLTAFRKGAAIGSAELTRDDDKGATL